MPVPDTMRELVIDGESLTIGDVIETGFLKTMVLLSDPARRKIEESRAGIERILESGEITYGINTGFGAIK